MQYWIPLVSMRLPATSTRPAESARIVEALGIRIVDSGRAKSRRPRERRSRRNQAAQSSKSDCTRTAQENR
eukprot:2630757-Prymnesium_polylepis.1